MALDAKTRTISVAARLSPAKSRMSAMASGDFFAASPAAPITSLSLMFVSALLRRFELRTALA
jgi:hypothetical protein